MKAQSPLPYPLFLLTNEACCIFCKNVLDCWHKECKENCTSFHILISWSQYYYWWTSNVTCTTQWDPQCIVLLKTQLHHIPHPNVISQLHHIPCPHVISQLHHNPDPNVISQLHHNPDPNVISQLHHTSHPDVISQLHHTPHPNVISQLHQWNCVKSSIQFHWGCFCWRKPYAPESYYQAWWLSFQHLMQSTHRWILYHNGKAMEGFVLQDVHNVAHLLPWHQQQHWMAHELTAMHSNTVVRQQARLHFYNQAEMLRWIANPFFFFF